MSSDNIEMRMQVARLKQKLADAEAICDPDIQEYGLIWERVVNSELPQLERLYEIIKTFDLPPS